MTFIILSVLLNSLLFVILKAFSKYNIDTLTALVVNYGTAYGIGYFMTDDYSFSKVIESEWLYSSLLLGFLFISVFFATALTAQRNGLSVASVASKMSVIIPIGMGVFFFKDALGFLKIIGVVLALFAVFLTSKKESGTVALKNQFLWPMLVFFGAGLIDGSLKLVQHFYLQNDETYLFTTNTFLIAFIIGTLILLFKIKKNPSIFKTRNVLAGIALGIPNFFALYYMIKMLGHETWDSSTIFTVHNVAIVLLTTAVGIALFREKISITNGLGIVLALISIALMTL
ncbi:MAG: EamA family transporter [Flavobacterium sp.]